MTAYKNTLFSILILVTMFLISDSNAVPEVKSRARRALESVDQGVLGGLANVLTVTPVLLLDLLDCIEQEVPYLNCNINFSVDPFYIIKQCSLKNDKLKIVADRIEQRLPALKSSVAIPPTISKDVCYGGIPKYLQPSAPGAFDALPFGSGLASLVGTLAIAIRGPLDEVVELLYAVLRFALSLGTAPPPPVEKV